MNIKTIVLTVMSLAVFASCNQKPAKENIVPKVEIKEDLPTIKLGESVKTLLNKKDIQYNTQRGTKYTLTDKSLNNITFQEVDINCFDEECDTIKNLCYGSFFQNTNINEKYTQLLLYLKQKYKNPTLEKQTISADRNVKYTKSIWKTDNLAISLYATVPMYEQKGGITVIFTTLEDMKKFPIFFQ